MKEDEEGQPKEPTPGEGGGQGGQGKQEQPTITETQLKERLARQAGQLEKKYADYEDLKAAAAELEKIREQELSEKEKLQKQVEKLEAAAADTERQAQARELEFNERLIRAEVRVLAATMGFVSPDDAYHLADLADVKVEEDGTVKGVKKALESLQKDKPYLLAGDDGKGGVGTPPRSGRKATPKGEAAPVRVSF